MYKNIIFLFSMSLFFFAFQSNAQSIHLEQDENHVLCSYESHTSQAYEKAYRNHISSGTLKSSSVVHTIPVVVHIIHNGSPLGSEDNPTDAQIASVISQASARFRHMQPGAKTYTNPFYGVDPEIELCLANVDPDGNYTSGVVRHFDPVNYLSPSNSHIMDNVAWDTDLYANMIIAKEVYDGACGVYISAIDVTQYSSGCWWSGLIAHEMGHYFTLAHIFNGCTNGDCLNDGDLVCDTPPKNKSGFNGSTCEMPSDLCSTDEDDTSTNNPYRPVAMGGMGNQPDMLENYMDYTGGCWDAFTIGQKDRMKFNITNSRISLTDNSATACGGSATAANDIGVFGITTDQSNACQQSISIDVSVHNYGSSIVNSFTLNYFLDNTLVHTQTESSTIPVGGNINVSISSPIDLPIGQNQVLSVSTSLPNGNTDQNSSNDVDYRKLTYLGGTSCSTFSACSDFDPGSNADPIVSTIVNILGSYNPTSSNGVGVQICVTVNGDVSYGAEVFEIFDESNVSVGFTNYHGDCAGAGPEFCFIASKADYNLWRLDNNIQLTLTPISDQINPTLCDVTNEACASIIVPEGGDDCPPSYSLANGNMLTGDQEESDDFETNGIIQSNQIIFDPFEVHYDSGTSIDLMEGFEVQLGAIFQAFIDGCGNLFKEEDAKK